MVNMVLKEDVLDNEFKEDKEDVLSGNDLKGNSKAASTLLD